ncbi:uncharacterized protein LOC127266165 [Andrographis paniculata]|uniref:uncharacterized protein LOC127266165 n=1 Tax=Andrographis paniculata TaxID=175694 RepID=UPI0021E98B1E|nr:uncharacterized protein LOC127266165 [Andrographis paniculata]
MLICALFFLICVENTPKGIFWSFNFGESLKKARMRSVLLFLILLSSSIASIVEFRAEAAPAGPLVKHLSSLVKWTKSSSRIPHQSDGNVLQFEDGYLVETVVEGNELGTVPYKIRVSQDGDLFAVDAVNSNIVRITPPLSHYSRARLVAGSFQGRTGHVDGKPSDARFNHPKGVTMDDKGNVYVADTANLAIRKIGESGVTTIAGGKSHVAGYNDGPSEDAKFSNDFDVIYVRSTCSLLVIDRGNAALRQISLSKEDCYYNNSSGSLADLLMVAGAILIGYTTCVLQQGFGTSFFPKSTKGGTEGKLNDQSTSNEIPTPVDVTAEDEQIAGWPSFGQLIWDLAKFALEAVSGIFVNFIPQSFNRRISKKGLTPLKDSLIMPEDEPEPPSALKQRAPTPLAETRQANGPIYGDRFSSEVRPPKTRSSTLKDPSPSTKHRSSKRQEYAEYYGSGEAPQYEQIRSKGQKERKHRHRDKTGDPTASSALDPPKPSEIKPSGYDSAKYDPYNFRSKYGY